MKKSKGKSAIGIALIETVKCPLSNLPPKSIFLSNTKPQNSAASGT
jgi:hypothetical protein